MHKSRVQGSYLGSEVYILSRAGTAGTVLAVSLLVTEF